MITARPFDDLSALPVFQQLDPSDVIEAELVRGAPSHYAGLFADWRTAGGYAVLNLVIQTGGGTPFAVLAIANTGQAGVASAALLARDHRKFRRPLAELAREIRNLMPTWAKERGIHRIEARAWTDHPTACRFLPLIGFRAECDMPGFGRTGAATFRQFAWLSPALGASSPPACSVLSEGSEACAS